jgi:hypothetical protein
VAPSRSFDVRSAGPGDAEAVAACFHASVHGLTGAHYDARQRAAWAPDPPDVPAWRDRLGVDRSRDDEAAQLLMFTRFAERERFDRRQAERAQVQQVLGLPDPAGPAHRRA